MQAQVLRESLRSVHGLFLRLASRRRHEQTVLVYTWWPKPGVVYPGRPQERRDLSLRKSNAVLC